jgi:hypothetical protein
VTTRGDFVPSKALTGPRWDREFDALPRTSHLRSAPFPQLGGNPGAVRYIELKPLPKVGGGCSAHQANSRSARAQIGNALASRYSSNRALTSPCFAACVSKRAAPSTSGGRRDNFNPGAQGLGARLPDGCHPLGGCHGP